MKQPIIKVGHTKIKKRANPWKHGDAKLKGLQRKAMPASYL